MKLRPLGTMGMTPRINFDGFINIRGGDDCYGYTQVFRNGIVEATKVNILSQTPYGLLLPSLPFDQNVFEVLPTYMEALRDLGIPPPIVFSLSLLGVRGAKLGVSNDQMAFDPPPAIDRDVLELPE